MLGMVRGNGHIYIYPFYDDTFMYIRHDYSVFSKFEEYHEIRNSHEESNYSISFPQGQGPGHEDALAFSLRC